MNRRHFLKFIPLIPIAIGLVKLPKPAESVTIKSSLETVKSIIARQRILNELMERSRLPAPANGHSYSDGEVEIIKLYTRRWIKQKIHQERFNELLRQKVMEMLAK